MLKLIIFDKDGTLIKELPDAQLGTRPANLPAEQELLPAVLSKLRSLSAFGVHLAIASNQGGVSWGFISLEQAFDLMNDVVFKTDGLIEATAFCPYDARGKLAEAYEYFADFRKPKPGMLLGLMKHFGVRPEETLYVGDRDSDLEAAEAAGVAFKYAYNFFGWEQTGP